MKNHATAAAILGSVLACPFAAAFGSASPPDGADVAGVHDATDYESLAVRFQRKADFYATLTKEYAAGTKPAVTGQSRHFADLRDRFQRLAEQNRALALQAGRP